MPPPTSSGSPRQLFRDDALRLAAVAPPRYLRGLEHAPAVARMTARGDRRRPPSRQAGATPAIRSSPTRICRLGALSPARVRARRRWPVSARARRARPASTWPRCAGGPATCSAPGGVGRRGTAPSEDRRGRIALVIAAEAASRPRPSRARPGSSPTACWPVPRRPCVDRIFAGMPRSGACGRR